MTHWMRHVEYTYERERWVINRTWNGNAALEVCMVELIAPNEPRIQVHIETVASAIDQMVAFTLGEAATKLKLGAAALGGEGSLTPDAGTETPSS